MDDENPYSDFFNDDPQAWAAIDELATALKTGEGIVPGSEVEKLYNHHKDAGIKSFHYSPAAGWKGTAEEFAKGLNDLNDWFKNPKNQLVSKIDGKIMMMADSLYCIENAHRVVPEAPYFIPVELSTEEKSRARHPRETIDLLTECREAIQHGI